MVQAKDITDSMMLAAVRVAQERMQREFPEWGDTPVNQVWANLGYVQDALPSFLPKVVLAKLAYLVRGHVLCGCTCGCRGDFHLASPPAKEEGADP